MRYGVAWGKQEQTIILYAVKKIDAHLFELRK